LSKLCTFPIFYLLAPSPSVVTVHTKYTIQQHLYHNSPIVPLFPTNDFQRGFFLVSVIVKRICLFSECCSLPIFLQLILFTTNTFPQMVFTTNISPVHTMYSQCFPACNVYHRHFSSKFLFSSSYFQPLFTANFFCKHCSPLTFF